MTRLALLFLLSVAATAQEPEPAPVLNVHGVDGHEMTVHPAEIRRPLLVHFFSLQDPGWGNELLRLKSFNDRYAGRGLALISFAAPKPGAKEVLAAFAVKHAIHFPLAVDDGNLSAFSGDKIPRLVLISPDAAIALRLYDPPADGPLAEVAERLPAMFERAREIRKLEAEGARRQKEIEAAGARVTALTPEELKARLPARPALFFIGDQKVFDEKHIPGAVHLDSGEVDAYFRDKDKAREWIFYCDCTHDALGRSGRVAAELYLKGFKRTAYLKGQLQGWEKRGYPLEGRNSK